MNISTLCNKIELQPEIKTRVIEGCFYSIKFLFTDN